MKSKGREHRHRSYWLKTLHTWHWVSSALCLVGMLLFTVTGFTLNHAGEIKAKPRVTRAEVALPEALRTELVALQAQQGRDRTPVPEALSTWVHGQWALDARGREAEWSESEVYVALPRPGGDAWVRVGLTDAVVEYEHTDRGWISYFNDLHKGRHTGVVWRWFIDIFALVCLVFTVTGLFILQMHAGNRPFTWPVTGLGLLIPVLLALLLIH